MPQTLTVLGIETSCDETAAAVVRGCPGAPGEVLSNVVFGQSDLHARYGGVVPEIAARAHAERCDGAVAQALAAADVTPTGLDAVAVTAGPGLIGGVLAGVMTAEGFARGTGRRLIGVNHLEGHALTPRLTDGVAFPYLLLLVSGGHCQILAVEGLGRYRRMGGTIDDAPGEAFDKVAKLIGLGFPGGPAVERAAEAGDPARFAFPRSMLGRPGGQMSFSGLKTAVVREVERLTEAQGGVSERDVADLCASFQLAVRDVLVTKTAEAMAASDGGSDPVLAVAGGVAANRCLRAGLEIAADAAGFRAVAPPLALCTDNGAMIAWAGIEHLVAGAPLQPVQARPRWPLDTAAAPMLGSGRKGAKA
ncbi:MAG: tRNA (adenosine(37)-N6)-threonylcarbamoyltransferase complex transferase subunit TsaD [Pseudomonadota bacterium]